MSQLVDVHTHFLTKEYVAAARLAGMKHLDGMPGWPTFNIVKQLAEMNRRGIARVVLSISSPGVHLMIGHDEAATALARHVNNIASGFVRDHPGRFAFFASLSLPNVDASVTELNRAMDAGAAGAIVESNIRGRYLGNQMFERIWAELDRRHGVLFIHPNSPSSWESISLGLPRPVMEFLFDSTRTVVDLLQATVLARHPGMRVLMPHSGATLAVLADRIEKFLALHGTDGLAAAEWESQLAAAASDMAGTPSPRAIPALTSLVGHDPLLYGSDSCWTPAASVDTRITSIDAADPPDGWQSRRELTTSNATSLLTTSMTTDQECAT